MTSIQDRERLLLAAAPTGAVVVRDASTVWLDFQVPADSRSVKFAFLDESEDGGLVLRIYPADTLAQARIFYGSPSLVQRLLALSEWKVEPNFHWGFAEKGLCWSAPLLSTQDYVAYWISHIRDLQEVDRPAWSRTIETLIADRIMRPADRVGFDESFTKTNRNAASPRPGLKMTRRWPVAAARQEEFAETLRQALREVVTALGQPLARSVSAASGKPGSIHFICRGRLNLHALKHPLYESGNWDLSSEDAARVVGGLIFLHETKAERSYFGGRIEGFREIETDNARSRRVVFRFTSSVTEGKGREWQGDDSPRAWTSGVVDGEG